MKKILFFLMILWAAIVPMTLQASGSGWYLYVWDYSTSAAASMSGQEFQTTSTSNVYVLESFEITSTQASGGLGLTIHDSGWSNQYGWTSSAGASITSTGTPVLMGAGGSSKWCQLPEGTYDLTFNYNDLTLQFDVHTDSGGGTGEVLKVSILGDSYSTFYGYMTPSDNASWYSTETTSWYSDNDVQNVNDTWWKKFFDNNSDNYELLVNNSYSGSTISNNVLDGMEESTSFINRCTELGDDPDVILIFGGTNDWWHAGLEMGDYIYTGWTDADLYKFRPALAYLINSIKTTYSEATLYFILNDMIEGDVYNSIMTVCDHYGIPVIAPQNIAKGSMHPTVAGMATIADAVEEALVNNNYGAGNNWIFYEYVDGVSSQSTVFTQSDYNPNIYVIEEFTPAGLDDYDGFSAYIGSADWSEGYRCGTASSWNTMSGMGTYLCDQSSTQANNYISTMLADSKYRLLWDKITHRFSIESGEDEGNNWYIYATTTDSYTGMVQSTTDENKFYAVLTLSDNDIDNYGGYYFAITPSGTSYDTGYTYNEKMYAIGTYTMASLGGYVVEGDTWTNAFSSTTCVALTAGNTYTFIWDKKTHRLTINAGDTSEEEGVAVATADGITYRTYPDQHALVTAIQGGILRGGDISMLNYVEDLGAKFYDADGNEKDALDIMQENGVNIVRLRLYNNPGQQVSYYTGSGSSKTTYTYKLPSGYLNQDDILNLAQRAKAHNMQIVLTFHYSDFWTNGSTQIKPAAWKNINSLTVLGDSVYNFTANFLERMSAQGTVPDYVALGNEIQGGLLFGYYDSTVSNQTQIDNVGGYNSNMDNVSYLLGRGSAAVRAKCTDAKVVIHLALSASVAQESYKWFFDEMKSDGLDYDVIGTSYYPYWSNAKPSTVSTLANYLYNRYKKDLLVMETGYSWTQYRPSGRYGGNYEGQLSLNGTAYAEASEEGQKSFMQEMNSLVENNAHILGYLYWDPVMVEQKVNNNWIPTGWVSGGENLVGNTTWFDYEGKALPVLEAIAEPGGNITIPATVTIDGVNYIVETEEPLAVKMTETNGAVSDGSNGVYDTFYADDARLIPNGLTAYTASAISSPSMTLVEITGENIPAETGVVLHGEEGTYYFWPREDNTVITGNVLSGTSEEIAKPDGNIFTLGTQNDVAGFYAYSGLTLPAHKAYYVKESLRGDVDGNDEVSLSDLTLLIKYLNGYAVTIDARAANCDLEGEISVNDVTTLANYLLNRTW